MKKLLILLIIITLNSCGTKRLNMEAQALKNNFLVSEGMSKQQVIDIMGNPVASEFNKGVEEFHYCATGRSADQFVSFYFQDGKVVSKTSYSVTLAEAGATGNCSKFIKRGTYRTPDNVIEIRASVRNYNSFI